MSNALLHQKLASFCSRALLHSGELSGLERLSGGASMESWGFVYGDREYVLRRLPAGMADDDDAAQHLSLAAQADIIDCAVAAGVMAPMVRGRLTAEDGLGEGFIMDKAQGETLPHKIIGRAEYAEAQAALTDQCAAQLAKIHTINPATVPDAVEYQTAAELVAAQREKYDEIGGAIPIYEYAFRWLADNAPATAEKKLVHGDFRMGNLMIAPSGLSAVLDWELVRFGDPVQDLAYFCTPSWRFGQYEKVAGGIDTAEAFLSAYASHSGAQVDIDRFRYWLIYSTLWWGVVCLEMGQIWRDGGDRSLERTVIGRRVSEVEIDLALLFEEILPSEVKRPIDWSIAQSPANVGETGYTELLTALSEWNSEYVLPGLDGHDRFQSRVAGNALGIAQRQAQHGAAFRVAANDRLDSLGFTHRQLCKALASGDMTHDHPGLWDHLRLSALERLSIDQPKYAGLKVALDTWSEDT